MSVIENDCVVEIEFTLKTKEGNLIDSSPEGEPLKFVHGRKRISPQLEEALAGKKVGDKFKLPIAPAEAYGERDENLVHFAEKDKFDDDFDKISVGMPLELENSNGEIVLATAKEIREDGIVIDGNHPLAGQTLVFDIKVLTVRAATEEDLKE
jgi:FKBP-type peptidyl-prolyl cis-trans isomerase SlyD